MTVVSIKPFDLNAGCTYQASDIFLTLFHSADLGIPSIEALKLVNANDLGVLIGQSRAPDKTVIRDHLSQMASHYLSEKLIEDFAHRVLLQGRIDREVFFIDGHFLPYYGLNVIAKGYYTVRRLAMRGNEIYAVTDLQGRPLFFITETNEIDFRLIINRCTDRLKGLGINRPILVFDRGGYGINFFASLGKEADFITWAKYVSDKALQEIPEENFVAGIHFGDGKYLVAETERTVSESSQTAKREGRSKPTTIDIRMVVLKDIDSGKRMGIFTSNKSKPCWDIALYMLHRWGDSENFFKEMMARFNLNYHPGYDISELENQPLVDNPDIPLVKKAIKILKQEVNEIEKNIHATKSLLDKRSDHRLATKLTKLGSELEEKKVDISGFENKLSSLPEKVSIIDLLKGKRMSRCDLEKKKLYDLIQFMAFHSRERLVELFQECYCDKRDIKQVLDMITGRGGYVKLIGQTLVVLLDWIQSKKHREAAERLCQTLNRKQIWMNGRLKARLFFCISNIPHRALTFDDDELHKLI